MQLKLIRHLWGVTDGWETSLPRFKSQGYVGIEAPMPQPDQAGRFRDLLQQHGFELITQTFTKGDNVKEHVKSFAEQLERAAKFGCICVNCHSGRDGWTRAEAQQFYAEAMKVEADCPVPVGHETHRGRVFFHPWITRDMLQEFAALKLCCDFSHWACVCERLVLEEEREILDLCASRCLHVHARVGYHEGPQVPDPSAPEYRKALETHERWWDVVWASQQSRGMKVSTLTPEFGPPMYLHTLPHTNVPVADLESVCNWQAKRQAERFAAHGGG